MAGMSKPAAAPQIREEAEGCRIRLNYDSLHDLVGPANQVCSLTALLLKQYHGQIGDAEAIVEYIQSSASRLQNLLLGLRVYTKVVASPTPLRRCDANALLAGSVSSLQTMIDDSGATITQDLLPEIYCDPNQIGYVFAGLVENSIKFRGNASPAIHVSAAPQEQHWLFSIRDNGQGVDSKSHERIFSIFKRIHHDKYPGAGVGLAIAQAVIERHGGRIWVESEVGHGATFFFTLPKEEGPKLAQYPE
jgi:two-component system, chemotaxis family, sensor kinase Cph1